VKWNPDKPAIKTNLMDETKYRLIDALTTIYDIAGPFVKEGISARRTSFAPLTWLRPQVRQPQLHYFSCIKALPQDITFEFGGERCLPYYLRCVFETKTFDQFSKKSFI
jgi:hypothetical protein